MLKMGAFRTGWRIKIQPCRSNPLPGIAGERPNWPGYSATPAALDVSGW